MNRLLFTIPYAAACDSARKKKAFSQHVSYVYKYIATSPLACS